MTCDRGVPAVAGGGSDADAAAEWISALPQRHLAKFEFPEVTRALRALSSAYVERRGALARGAALDTAGKRAAFALFFGPLHFFTVREIVRRLDAARDMPPLLVDLGCGTGAAGAAWALESPIRPRLLGIDRHPWAVAETEWTWRTLGLSGRASRGDVLSARWGGRAPAVIAGYVVNELNEEPRQRLLNRLIDVSRAGGRVLLVEPIARRVAPWWDEWREAFEATGGRADEWTLALDLPDSVRRLDKAAGLRHDQLKARSIYSRPADSQERSKTSQVLHARTASSTNAV